MSKPLAILVCASIVTFSGCSDSGELEASVSKLESEKQVLVTEKRKLQDRLSKYETGMVGIRSKLDRLKSDAEYLDRNVDSLKSYIDGFGYYEWHSVAANVRTASARVATDSKGVERGIHDLELQINQLPKP